MIYKAFEYAGDTMELENIVKFDQVTPILASAATGVFYKSTGAFVVLVWLFAGWKIVWQVNVVLNDCSFL